MSTEQRYVNTRSLQHSRPALPEPYSIPVIEDWLVSCLSQRLGIPCEALDVHQPLIRYGLDSMVAFALVTDLEDWLGCPLPLTLAWDCPTIAAIARCVATSPSTAIYDSPGTITSSGCETPSRGPQMAQPAAGATYPLSYGQQAVWFLSQQGPESIAYNITRAVRIWAALDVSALQGAFQKLVDRHAVLRTTLPVVSGTPVQQVHEHMEVCFRTEDAATWSLAFLHARLHEEACRPFDLEHGPLLRVHLYSRSAHEHILLLTAPHIVVDFWSLAVLVHELGLLYQAALSGIEASLPPLTQHYTDYVRWQADMLDSAAGERLWAYWRQQLAGELPVLELPTDRTRPPVQTYGGTSRFLRLGATLTQRLRALSQEQGTTLYTTLLAAFYVLLHHYTSQDDLLVGSPMAGRSQAKWARLVGYVVSAVALRITLAGDPTFTALLGQVRQMVLEAFAHQDYPFMLLVERLRVWCDPSRSPLFQVMFVLQKAHRLGEQDLTSFVLGDKGGQIDIGGLHLEMMAVEQPVALFDLTLTMAEVEGDLAASMQYNTALFDTATIARMLGHFQTLLEGIVTDPHQRISTLPLPTEANRCPVLIA